MARLDTGWCVHPKVLGLSVAGMAVHAWSISYCDLTRSDGFIPEGAWPAKKGFEIGINEVLKAGLWTACENGGFLLHDFTVYNRTRAQIELEQAQSNERVRHFREARNAVSNGAGNGVSLARERAPGPGPGPGETLRVSPETPPNPPRTLAGGADGADGTSSRAAPRSKEDDDPAVIHAEAGVCPLCRVVYTGAYIDHTAIAHAVRPAADGPGNLGGSMPKRGKGAPPPVAPTPEMEAEFEAMHRHLQELC